MVTISEIAEKSHVSRTLVSRVLNNKPGVSPDNRKRILSVIDELKYKPNALARSLVTQKTQTIGIVMDTLCDMYFFNLISGIQNTAEKYGYNVVFCSANDNLSNKMKYVDFFSQGITDGVIAYGSYLQDEKVMQDIASRNSSFVLIEGSLPNLTVNNVLLNNYKGAYQATEHLIKKGYKKIRHFTADMNYQCSLDRLSGFVNAMRDYSIPIASGDIVSADFELETGYQQMKRIIEDGDIPDAIFFGADQAAFGAARAMSESGLKIREDIALIGFDDDLPTDRDFVYPKLSTLRQPLYDMGAESVNILVRSIQNPEMKPIVKVFDPELILRETCD